MSRLALASLASVAVGMILTSTPVAATPFIVDAKLNSSTGGVGLPTTNFLLGQVFSTSASSNDLWSAGALPRWSDAGGLTGIRLATGTDESGQPLNTQIGADFGVLNLNGLNAPFGSLVGEIGGVYQLLGLNFTGPAWGTGTLNLYYWDSNNSDNVGQVTVDVPVPEPATIALLGMGLLGVFGLRRRKAKA